MRVATTERAARHRLEQRLAERLEQARLADDVGRGDPARDLVVRDAADDADAFASLEARAQRPVADEGELPSPSRANASARRTTFFRSVREPTQRNAGDSRCAASRRSAEALEVDARVDDLGLAARLRELRLELAAQVVRHGDHRGRALDDAARERGDARDRADVANVAAVRGDDERRVDVRRDQAGRHEEVRVDDVRLARGADAPRELHVAPLAAAAAVEHRELDLVPAVAEGALHLRDEHAEVGVVRPRVHLRHEQDPHRSYLRAETPLIRLLPHDEAAGSM